MSLMRPIADMREQMDRIFHEMEELQFPSLFGESPHLGERHSKAWLPAVDLTEKNGNYEIRMEVPGIKPDDIDVQIAENAVIIRGHSKEEKVEEKKDVYRRECHYGALYRRIPLPTPVKQEQVSAELKHGVLTLKLPKSEEQQGKRISIQSK